MKEDATINRKASLFLLAAIFLISFSLISFEITLSRILSVLLSYHYVFFVLSFALLGLGIGGVFVHFFRPGEPGDPNRFGILATFSSLFSLAVPVSPIMILWAAHIDNDPSGIIFYGLFLFAPFFLGGALLAEVYRMFPAVSAKTYGLDLVGAAAGSLAVVPVLNILGGINANFFLGAAAAMAALLFALGGRSRNKRALIMPLFSFLMVSVLFGAVRTGALQLDIPIGKNPAKEIHDVLYGPSFKGKIIDTKWSAFGRTDLVELRAFPDQMDIYLDGTAGSPMYRFSGDINHPGPAINKLKETFPGYFPFLSLPEQGKNDALIIGPGGGRDVLLAMMGGVKKITAVEVNPDLVKMVQKYSGFNGGIYTSLDRVRVVVDEGRNFLKRQKGKYDLIMFSLPVTNTSRSLEGYALTENFLFTTDSIHDYWDHLTEEGRLLVVGHDDVEILRLLSISLAALRQRGVAETQAMECLYITGSDDYLVFVLQKKPLDRKEVLFLYQAMQQLGYNPKLSYFPYIGGPLNPALTSLGRGQKTFRDLENMVRERGYDISPVSDNDPFFFKFEKGMPNSVSLVFWPSIMLLVFMGFIPLIWGKKQTHPTKPSSGKKRASPPDLLQSVVLFSMLGIGFMLMEISFIQRFVLFLGQPVLSLSVLLFSLLVGAGIGSLWSGRLPADKIGKGIAIASLSVAGMVLGYTFLLPVVFNQLLGFNPAVRLCATVFMLIPLGFWAGFPFPLGIRLLKELGREKHIPWMWGINGAGSVVGSTLTIVVAISWGFTAALFACACCYFIIFLLFR
jgi:predicted membrane-bound spermidine synthase